MILLDTNVISEYAKPQPDPRVLAWFAGIDDDALWLSVLSLGEIRKGAELLPFGPRRQKVESWLASIQGAFAARILPVDEAVAQRWGVLSAKGLLNGLNRPPIDTLLAATALTHGLSLATRNTADFAETGVDLIDPWGFPLP